MAALNERFLGNVAGAFYVSSACIDCDMCRSTAPQFFSRHDENGYSFVHRQPVTPEEFVQADEARRECPTETIGHDG